MIKRPININHYLKSKSIFFLWIILFFRIGFVFGQSDAPDINEVIKNKTPLEQIMELNELSRQYRNSDIESALNFCIKAYEISVTSDNKTGMAISLKNIGIIDYIIGRYDSALVKYNKALKLFETINDQSELMKVKNNVALIYIAQADFLKAINHLCEILQFYRINADTTEIIRSLYNLGNCYYYTGEYLISMECYREAIILNEKMENDQIKVDLFIGIGALYEAQDLLENALVEYRTALALAKKMNNRSRQGVILTNIANVYLQQDEANSALEMLTTAYLIRESLDDQKGMAYVLNLMGMAYEKLGQPDRAKELYISSLKISQTLGNMREVATTLSFMGVNLIKENNYHSAIEYIKTSIQITDSAQMLHELSENYKLMVFSYSAIGLTDSAEWYLDSYLKLKQYLQLSPEELNKFDITTKSKDDLIKKENRILIKQGEQLLFSLSLFWAIVLTLIAGLVIFIFILTVLLALRPKYRKRFLLKMFK